MDILEAIAGGWKWKGIEPVQIIDQNAFGNVIVRTRTGAFWRICPEELDAKPIADSEARLEAVRNAPEFILDWKMDLLVQKARRVLGEPGQGRCYCLKIPAVLGGEYDDANIGTITVSELLSFSGDLAKQIDDVPDGSKVRLIVK
jgi:hypothetical protein